MKISQTESERLAEKFFNTCSPWNEMQDHGHFGVHNLAKDVSALLVKYIEKK